MNNCRPGIEPAITGPDGGGRRQGLASRRTSRRGGRWRLPVTLVGGAQRLVAVGAIALAGYIPLSWAAVAVDNDIMFQLVGVSPNPPDPIRRRLTYRAEPLTAAQKTFLGSTDGRLRVWQKYSFIAGGPATSVWWTDPGAVDSVTQWNKAVSGVSSPGVGYMVTRVSEWEYEKDGRFGTESCVGIAPTDHVPVSSLLVMPGTTCQLTPPSTVSCDVRVTDVIDLGTLATGQRGGGNGMITAVCQGAWPVYITLGPVLLSNNDSDLQGLVGAGDCRDLKPTETLTVPVGSPASGCLHVEGSFATTGAKRIPGVLITSFQ